jgi:hypothetical protein
VGPRIYRERFYDLETDAVGRERLGGGAAGSHRCDNGFVGFDVGGLRLGDFHILYTVLVCLLLIRLFVVAQCTIHVHLPLRTNEPVLKSGASRIQVLGISELACHIWPVTGIIITVIGPPVFLLV